MTDREEFKAAFLLKCAEDGLSVDEIRNRALMVREAMTKTAFNLQGFTGAAKDVAAGAVGLTVLPALAGGIGGVALGNLAGRVPQPGEDPLIEEIHGKELVRELQRLTEEARVRTAARRRKQMNPLSENRGLL